MTTAYYYFFNLSNCDNGGLFRKSFSVPVCSRLSSTFSSVRSSVSGFILRVLLHLELNFVQGDIYGSICILLCSHAGPSTSTYKYPVRPASDRVAFASLSKNQVFKVHCFYVWAFNLILLINLFVFMPVPCSCFFKIIITIAL